LSAVWGSSFIFIKLSVETIQPVLLTFYRLVVASIFLFFFCEVKKIKFLFLNNKKDLFIIALFGNVIPFNLISWSELYVDSLVASTLIGTMPLFTFLISLFFFKESFKKIKILLGLLIGFLGMYIFIDPQESIHKDLNLYFSLLIILSSIMYAFSATWVKTLKNKSSLELAFSSIAVASFISFLLIIVSIMIQNDFTNLSINEVKLGSIISATILGVLCTGLAIWVFFKLIEKENAVFASQSNYLIPCFGFLWSFLFLDERLSFNLFIGLVLIVLGAFIVNNK